MTKHKTTLLNRRHFMQMTALASGTMALTAAGSSQVFAQQAKVVVGTWGGDYARLLTKNIEDPILKPKGIESVQDQASDAPRRATGQAPHTLFSTLKAANSAVS